MGIAIVSLSAAIASAAIGITTAAVVAPPGSGSPIPDFWSVVQAGGAPMAVVLALALLEVTRRHDKAYRLIEQKDAVILAMAQRQVEALKASSDIASDQMKIAQNTEILLRELVTLGRGKVG